MIQSLDGGVLSKLLVKEGDIVEQGQILAQLDPTRSESTIGESTSIMVSAEATAARLRAELNGTSIQFPKSVHNDPHLVAEQMALYHSRRANLNEAISGYQHALSLVQQELNMTEPLVKKGAASEVEVLRLKREANDLLNKMTEVKNQYSVQAKEELAKVKADIDVQKQVIKGWSDTLKHTVFKAPVKGIVKEIDVITIGA